MRLVLPTASAEETAAIVAAVERFWRASATPPAPAGEQDPWLRAAILEGVSRQAPVAGREPWINT
jgi:hypothetical protein